MSDSDKILGVAMILAGSLLVSPADEAAVALGTMGISLPTAPAQAAASSVAGLALIGMGLDKLR